MAKKRIVKIRTIDIQAKEWFDKTYGNSYFSCSITLNYQMKTERYFEITMQYGYGDQYLHESFNLLQREGYIKEEEFNSRWKYIEDNKIILRHNKQDNCLKRDLIH